MTSVCVYGFNVRPFRPFCQKSILSPELPAVENPQVWSKYGIDAIVAEDLNTYMILWLIADPPGTGKLRCFLDDLVVKAQNKKIVVDFLLNPGIEKYLLEAGFNRKNGIYVWEKCHPGQRVADRSVPLRLFDVFGLVIDCSAAYSMSSRTMKKLAKWAGKVTKSDIDLFCDFIAENQNLPMEEKDILMSVLHDWRKTNF